MPSRKDLYTKVLGLEGDFSIEQLKQQYRKRAKILHPDQNKHPRSHEQFVLLQDAYAYYSEKLERKENEVVDNEFKSKKYPNHYQKEPWRFKERKEARKRAAQRAKMKEENYHKLGYYKLLDKFFFIMDVMRFVLALFIVFVAPVLLFLVDGFRGIIICLFVQFITYPLWTNALKKFISIR